MAERVVARCGCRFDLAGGTLDIWPLGVLHPGSRTLNVAIDVPIEVEVARRESGCLIVAEGVEHPADSWEDLVAGADTALIALIAQQVDLPPAEVRLSSASPRGGGLGASSAIGAALVAAAESLMEVPERSPLDRARLLRDVEARLMGYPTGLQDHLPPMLGGLLEISYRPGGLAVRRVAVDIESMNECFTVAYTGKTHFSGATNWQVVRRRIEGDKSTVALFNRICEVGSAMVEKLEAGDLEAVGRLLGEEWAVRSRLAEGVSTPELERILAAAAGAGAWGGKAGGAGGGGCLGIMHSSGDRRAVREAVVAAGGSIIEASPTMRAMEVEKS